MQLGTVNVMIVSTRKDTLQTKSQPRSIPEHVRPALRPIAGRAFWWGNPDDWLDDAPRFAAQVMTFGNLEDTGLTLELLGDSLFRHVLENPPPGVFDLKSWTYWHHHYHLAVPPLPTRKL